MELFVFRHSEYQSLYNCSRIRIDDVPLEQRQFLIEPLINILLCAIYYVCLFLLDCPVHSQVLYLPCLWSIWRQRPNNSCYQILFFIGVMDLLVLWILGFFVGFMSLTGTVFCQAPTLIYWIGAITQGFAWPEIMADIVLALNRALDLLVPSANEILFSNKATFYWLLLCLLYGVYGFTFVSPCLYSSIRFGGWYFNPYAGYIDQTPYNYEPLMHVIQSYALAFLLPAIYVVFAVGFTLKVTLIYWNQSSSVLLTQSMMFLQILTISLFNASAGFIYMYAQQVTTVGQGLYTVAQFSWSEEWLMSERNSFRFHMHGSPPLIYLLLNKTIRNDCKQLCVKLLLSLKGGDATKNLASKIAQKSQQTKSNSHPTAQPAVLVNNLV